MIFTEPIDCENEFGEATMIFKMSSDYQTTMGGIMEEIQMEKFCPLRAIAGAIFALSGKKGLPTWGECIGEACAWFDPEKSCCGMKIPSGKTATAERYAE